MIKQAIILSCLLILCKTAEEDTITFIEYNFKIDTGFVYDNDYTMNILRGSVDAKQLDFTVKCVEMLDGFSYLFSDDYYDQENTTIIIDKLKEAKHKTEISPVINKFTFSVINSVDYKYKYFYLAVINNQPPYNVTEVEISFTTPTPSSPTHTLRNIIIIVACSIIGLFSLCVCITLIRKKGCSEGCNECCEICGDCLKCLDGCCRCLEACCQVLNSCSK